MTKTKPITNTPSRPPAKRRSLFDLAAMPAAEATPIEATPPVRTVARRVASSRANYPSATVYLPRRALRLIKEIALDENRRISDIVADAVEQYLTKRGHPSLSQLAE